MRDSEGNPDDILEVLITAPSEELLAGLIEKYEIDTGCTGVSHSPSSSSVIGMLSRREFGELSADCERRGVRNKASSPSVEIRENRTATAAQRRAMVGRGNRYATRSSVPQGLGLKE